MQMRAFSLAWPPNKILQTASAKSYEPQRQKVKDAIGAISVDGLIPAITRLKQIKTSPQQELPELDRRQLYEDSTIAVWRAYKDRMPEALKLMGFNMGFLFQNDQNN